MQVGPYRVLGEIARGGMGVVYRASDPEGRPVALKQILGQSGTTARRRFQREVQALARLQHPGVVSVLDCGEHEGRPWLALELIEGESLEERLRRGPLPVWEAIRVAKQLAQALSYVHGCGVLHRDLKPDNVLLRGGEALLTDFGLVLDDEQASRSRITATGIFQGTPGYWAPEQALGQTQRFGPHTDLYGLGAVLYACLTGRPPVQAETLQAYVAAAQARAVTPPRKLRAEVPEWLSALCMRCLAHQPDQRPAAAEDVARALLLGDASAGARTPLLGALTAAGVLLAFVLAALGAYVILAGDEPETLASTPDAPAPPEEQPEWGSPPTPTEPPLESDPEARALEFLRAATAKLRAEDFKGALVEFERAALLTPDEPRLHLRRGQARAGLGLHEEAIADFTRASELDPDLSAAYVERGASYAELRRWDPAVADFTRYVELVPNDAGGWVNRARCYMALGRLEETIADFSRALQLDPNNPRALGARGTVRGTLGRHEEAVADLSRALQLDPSSVVSYRGRAKNLIDLGRHREALADLDRVLELDPSGSLDWGQRGRTRMTLGQLEEAISDLNRAIEIDPQNPAWWNVRGVCKHRLGRHREALADYDESLERYPGNAHVWTNKGKAHANLQEYTEAEAAHRESLSRDPQQGAVWGSLGAALLAQGQKKNAHEAFTRAIELDSAQTPLYAARATVRFELGLLREALADCERTLELDPAPEVAAGIRSLREKLLRLLGR